MSLDCVPKFQMYEEESQIRRSMKSVRENIVQGYDQRRFKQDFIRFPTFAQASFDETIDHLEPLHETSWLNDSLCYERVYEQLDRLAGQLKLTHTERRSSTSLRPERTT